jgi:uncharacterized membrane protein
MSPLNEQQAQEYWRRNLSLMIRCLVIWFVVSYGCGIILADVLYVFVGLIFYYAKKMGDLDREFGVEEE